MTTLGQRLRGYRQMRGLRLHEVAPKIGTDAGSLSRIERDHRDPSLAQLRALADVYRVGVATLLGGESKRRNRAA